MEKLLLAFLLSGADFSDSKGARYELPPHADEQVFGKAARVRYFAADQFDEARAWLESDDRIQNHEG